MVRVLISYASFSGNTKEVAELIEERLNQMGFDVDTFRIKHRISTVPDPSHYDVILIGSFTWDRGSTPSIVKDFVLKIGYKPSNVFVFGTGDTQFGGDELFCSACDKLAKFYHSTYPPLKIEQSPRGSQETKVQKWTEGVIEHCKHYVRK
ncbi:flavodoxin [Bacillaceae bacterium W0354]